MAKGDTPVFDNTDFGGGQSGRRLRMPTSSGTERESINPRDDVDFSARSAPDRPEFYTHKGFPDTTLGMAYSEVMVGLETGMIPDEYIRQLSLTLPALDAVEGEYGVRFDLLKEINQQMNIIRGLRTQVFTATGQMRAEFEFKDAKYVLSANDGMLKTLMQKHKELVNMERFQKIETAVHSAMDKLDDKSRDIFTKELTRLLKEDES